jgi:hypothetical protein
MHASSTLFKMTTPIMIHVAFVSDAHESRAMIDYCFNATPSMLTSSRQLRLTAVLCIVAPIRLITYKEMIYFIKVICFLWHMIYSFPRHMGLVVTWAGAWFNKGGGVMGVNALRGWLAEFQVAPFGL